MMAHSDSAMMRGSVMAVYFAWGTMTVSSAALQGGPDDRPMNCRIVPSPRAHFTRRSRMPYPAAMLAEHPLFKQFAPFRGQAAAGYDVNYVGARTDVEFLRGFGWASPDRMVDR